MTIGTSGFRDPASSSPWISRAAAIALALLLGSLPVHATAQYEELLLLGGNECGMQSLPLEPYLAEHPDARPATAVFCTAMVRGYRGEWEITGGRLFLLDVEALRARGEGSDFETEWFSAMERMFPGRRIVPADWFTGYLIVPSGELVKYVHLGFASVYERYHVIRIDRGVVTQQQEMDTEQFLTFRVSQFQAFQQTPEYQQLIEQSMARGDSLERAEEMVFEVFTDVYLSQAGERP